MSGTHASDTVPPRALPLLYFGTAHLALALACALALWRPHAVAGFFYHSWLLALVHLVTLGWITFSIFGAFYLVGPLALRTEIRVSRWDYVAYALGVLGLIGMVAHFWIEQYSGMAWSAGTLAAGALYMTARIGGAARRARIDAAVRLHIILACLNFGGAAAMGILIGIHKATPFLPGFILSNVFAHAHLAAVGWATMMVVGIGYRLLPMVLPSKMPAGPAVYLSAVLLETGVVGLFAALLMQSGWSLLFGVLIACGVGAFGGHVVWMLRHRVPAPAAAARFDFAVGHAAYAGLCWVTALVLGVVLLVTPMSTASLHAAAAYGVIGLLGFLAQMVVGMETRLLPMASWYWAYAGSGRRVIPNSPHRMRDRSLQAIVLAGWLVGVPALASGMAWESGQLVAAGAASLLAAVGVATIDHVFVLMQTRAPR
jgi:hypothetical protein